jgi:hypothetical protein
VDEVVVTTEGARDLRLQQQQQHHRLLTTYQNASTPKSVRFAISKTAMAPASRRSPRRGDCRPRRGITSLWCSMRGAPTWARCASTVRSAASTRR